MQKNNSGGLDLGNLPTKKVNRGTLTQEPEAIHVIEVGVELESVMGLQIGRDRGDRHCGHNQKMPE